MRILLTGITGFIGSHLAKRLDSEGHEVYAVLRHSPRSVDIPSFVKVLTSDLTDIHGLKKAVRDSEPEIVIHTAAMTPVRHSFDNPYVYAETNYVGTMNIIHASLESPLLKKFIFASTAETYKPKSGLLKETDELTGSTPYGVSKVAADLYVRMAGDNFGLPYIILRPSNTYGRKTEKGYLMEKIITQMMSGNSLKLDGTPEPIRDMMYVDDHVEGYMKAVSSKCKNEVFNISTGRGLSIKEIIDICAKTLDWKGEVSLMGKPRPYDPYSLVLDNSKAKALLDWHPKVSLEEGILKVADYWRGK